MRIFISYRRKDSITITGRIYDVLASKFSNNSVFKDVDDIPLGVDFREVIQGEINKCDIVIVVIGSEWTSVEDHNNVPRIHNPDDFVRLEVEAAMENKDIVVIPVLVNGAHMPSASDLPDSLNPIVYLNAAVIREDPDFHRDTTRLMNSLLTIEKQQQRRSRGQTILEDNPYRNFYIQLRGLFIFFAVWILIGVIVQGIIEPSQFSSIANLKIGSVPAEDVIARTGRTFTSIILTEQERQIARDQTFNVYDPPDPNVARLQAQLTQATLEFIDNVRADSYATLDQKVSDIEQIVALSLEQDVSESLLRLTDDSWSVVRSEVVSVLERVMRQSIRESELQNIKDQLPTQVSIRLSQLESEIVVAIVSDIIRTNTFENPEKTNAVRDENASVIQPQQRQFVAGQTVANANEIIDELTYEALFELGMVQDSPIEFRSIDAIIFRTLITLDYLLIALIITVSYISFSIFAQPQLRSPLRHIYSFVNVHLLRRGSESNRVSDARV